MAEADIRPTGSCEQCGDTFVRTLAVKRFCSDRCQRRNHSGRPISRVYTCEGCSAQFRPKRTDRTRYCSRECSFSTNGHNAEGKAEAKAARALQRSEARRRRIEATERAREEVRRDRLESRTTHCQTCGVAVPYCGNGVPRSYCGDTCRKAGETWRQGRRIARATRKARVRAATVERFDPVEVLARDGWRCHICRRSTPPRLRGTTDPRAPELDHVVPLAKGGEHTRQNTACACRRCNILKGDKLIGQPLLFG